jgi:hypothetical protein
MGNIDDTVSVASIGREFMRDLTFYHERREALKKAYLRDREVAPKQVQTAGVDHLALIWFQTGPNDRVLY